MRNATLLIAKITGAGPAFWTLVEVHRGMYQLDGVEEHQLHTRPTVALRKASKIGLHKFCTPARSTGRGGAAGGAAVVCADRQNVTILEVIPGQAWGLPAEPPFAVLAPMILRLGPVTAALIVVYMTDRDELGGRHAAKCAELVAMVRPMGIPWIIAGDCNVSLGVFAGSAWLRYEGRVVVTPLEGAAPAQAKPCWLAAGPLYAGTDGRAREVIIRNVPGCAADPAVRGLGQLTTAFRFWCTAIVDASSKHTVWRTQRRLASQCTGFSREVTAENPRLTLGKTWCRDPAMGPAAHAALPHVRDKALVDDEVRNAISDKAVLSAMYSLSDRTAYGADATGPSALKLLPTDAEQALTAPLADCRRQGAWPWQSLLNTVVHKGISGAECWTVGLLPLFTRLGKRTFRSAPRHWRAAHEVHWDHALAGCSARMSALINALRVATARAQDQLRAFALWDVATGYGTACMAVSGRAARHQQYPPTFMALATLQCMAVRVLKAGCLYSDGVLPCSSMVAGGNEATDLVRAALHRAAEAITTSAAALRFLPAAGTSSYLDGLADDLRHLATSRSLFELAQELAGSKGALIDFLHCDGYILADKAVIVSTSMPDARAAQGVAATRRLRSKHKVVGADLGIDISSSKWRRVPEEAARRTKSSTRNTLILQLQVKKARRKLLSAVVLASQGYHVKVQGMPPTVMRRTCSALAKHPGAKQGWCTHIITTFAAGMADPEIRFKLDMVKPYIAAWATMPELRQGIKVAWAKDEEWLRCTPSNRQWYYIQRPLRATQAVIHVSRTPEGEQPHPSPQRNEVVFMDRSGSLRAAKFLSVPITTRSLGYLHSLGQWIRAFSAGTSFGLASGWSPTPWQNMWVVRRGVSLRLAFTCSLPSPRSPRQFLGAACFSMLHGVSFTCSFLQSAATSSSTRYLRADMGALRFFPSGLAVSNASSSWIGRMLKRLKHADDFGTRNFIFFACFSHAVSLGASFDEGTDAGGIFQFLGGNNLWMRALYSPTMGWPCYGDQHDG